MNTSPKASAPGRVVGLLLGLALVAAACTSSGSEPTSTDDTSGSTTETTVGSTTETTVGSTTTQVPPTERRQLRMGVFGEDVASMDPHFATSGTDRQIVGRIFDGLVRFKRGDFTAPFEPGLAVAVPEPVNNPDGTQTWTFELRQGVQCHAGPDTEAYELTSSDVVYSYQKSADPDRSAFAGDYTGWQAVEAIDDYTVAITLSEPRSPALFLPGVANYAGGFVVCEQAVEAAGDEAFNSTPVGTGPFAFSAYSPAESVVLAANDGYFNGTPLLSGVEFRFLPDDTTRDLALLAGEVDLIWGLPEGQWVERMNAEDGFAAVAFPVEGMTMFSLRTDEPPFDDVRVRQAVFHAVDKSAHTAVGGEGVATPVWSVVTAPGAAGEVTEAEAEAAGLDYAYDPERARELLAEAGYPDGFSFEVVSSPLQVYRDNYEILQAELGAVGIDMTIQGVDHATMHELIREGTNLITAYSAPRPTMDILLSQFIDSESIVVGGANPVTNFSYYASAEVDQLLDDARAATDNAEQARLWHRVNEIILEDAVILPLYVGANTFAFTDDLEVAFEIVAVIDNSFPIDETTGFRDS